MEHLIGMVLVLFARPFLRRKKIGFDDIFHNFVKSKSNLQKKKNSKDIQNRLKSRCISESGIRNLAQENIINVMYSKRYTYI